MIIKRPDREYQWVAKPSASVRRLMRRDGWKEQKKYMGRAIDAHGTGIVLMWRPIVKPPKATRKDIEALHAYLGQWLAEHR